VDIHHIISDGISIEIIRNDFMRLYNGKSLPPLKIQYKEYTYWKNNVKEKNETIKQALYWLNEFKDEIPVLDLPLDYSRPSIQNFSGDSIKFNIQEQKTQALKKLADVEGATLYMVLLSIYSIFLSKLGNQEDIIIGAPIAARRHPDLEHIIGMIVNTLALRNKPYGSYSFIDFLRQVKRRTISAFENQEYPLEDLIEKTITERDTGRNPLFDVTFILQNLEISEIKISGLSLKPLEFEHKISKFDLTLIVLEQEENLCFIFEYCTKLFEKETIYRFIKYFKTVLNSVLDNPKKNISTIETIPVEEKHRILYEFNQTEASYPKNQTLPHLFKEQVIKTPHHIAVLSPIMKSEDESEYINDHQISYKELNYKILQLASNLLGIGVIPDTIISIMVKRSLEMIIGILAILESGGAYLPIDPHYPEERIRFILKDSKTRILLTASESSLKISKKKQTIHIIDITAPLSTKTTVPIFNDAHSKRLAYIIYTSGSTGKPKGVMIEHHSLINRLNWMQKKYQIQYDDTILQKTPFTFDVSLWELFWWAMVGAKLCFLIPGGEKIPELLTQTIQKNHITTIHFVPSMLKTFLEYIEDRGEVKKLSSLKRVIASGEALTPSLVKYFNNFLWKYNKTRLSNLYGPTEATVDVSSFECPVIEPIEKIPIGKPIDNIKLLILNGNLRIQPIGVTGELYISGDGLARGYMNRSELTAEKFCYQQLGSSLRESFPQVLYAAATLSSHTHRLSHTPTHSNTTSLNHSTIYRTGDLARWQTDGNIEYIGRMDYQVKIRGIRIELGEIENQLLKYQEIQDALVLSNSDREGDTYLVAYIISGKITISHLREYLSEVLPAYMIPSYFMQIEKFPLTASGKLDRRALPKPVTKPEEDYTEPRNELEKKLIEIWTDVLHLEESGSKIGIDHNFFTLGGHSLKATILISKIQKILKIKIPLTELFKRPTIRRLTAFLKNSSIETYHPIQPIEKREYYLLSSAQKRLYFLHQFEKEETVYNIPSAWEITGIINKEKLEQVFIHLVQRHGSLRTTFEQVKGEPVQKIHDKIEFRIEYEKKKSFTDRTYIKTFLRPFDLSKCPLLRVGILKKSAEKHLLVIDMHHIIADGVSNEILVRDFLNLYQNTKIYPLRIHYQDYSQWQLNRNKKRILHPQKAYWLNIFSGEIPQLNLPVDTPRPSTQSFAGAYKNFELTVNQSSALTNIAKEENTTLFVVLFSLFYIFLSKITGQEDIVVGTPLEGRLHTDLSSVIGMFVNTLAMRNRPAGTKRIMDFIKEVRDSVLDALENQEYPFEELVEQLNLERNVSRNPLFDVAFTLHENMKGFKEHDIPGLTIKPYPFDYYLSKFEMTFTGTKENNTLYFSIEYCREIFSEETIEKWISFFNSIVTQALSNRDTRIGDIEIISFAEKQKILFIFNHFEPEYAKNKTLVQLFQEQVERTPDHLALAENKEKRKRQKEIVRAKGSTNDQINALAEVHLSYQQLNERIDLLANYLIKKGAKPDGLVGILTKRSIETIISILAILKTGCGYVPLNPMAPLNRNRYLLEECNIQLLVSNCLKEEIKEGIEIIDLRNDTYIQNIESMHSFSSHPKPELSTTFAYVIFTSGSTGKPKGVPITHSNLSPLLHWGYRHLDIGPSHHTMQNLSYFFDWSVWEICITITTGATLFIAPEEVALNTDRCAEFLTANAITVLHITPTQYSYLLKTGMKTGTLHYLFIGAEKLTLDLAQRSFAAVSPHCRVFNLYGPTEATIISAALEIHLDEIESYTQLSSIPIGKPAGNADLHILDNYLKLCPVNFPGELYIGGDCIAQGYLNNPELTAEKFCHQPPGDSFYKNLPLDPRKNDLLTHSALYKTGDLARWLAEGNIEYLGRKDYQVKIRGFRIELGEIENQILCNEHIQEVVVIDKEAKSGEKYLCAYIVPQNIENKKQDSFLEKLKTFLSLRLPNYMIPSNILLLEKIPLNPNGKVDRKLLSELSDNLTGRPYIAPRNTLEKKLRDIWYDILDRNPLHIQQPIGIDDNFFDLGGHSLKVMQMTSKLHKEYQIKLSLVEIFKTPTIRELANTISTAIHHEYSTLEPVEKKGYYELTSMQKRLFILQYMDEHGTGIVYNIPSVWTLTGHINKKKFEEVFQQLIQRHESLRTSFHMINEAPVQKIHSQVEFQIEYYNYKESSSESKHIVKTKPTLHENNQPLEAIINSFLRPFDLSRAPLLRGGLVKSSPPAAEADNKQDKAFLILDMHHIISDGMSMNVLIKDFVSLYRDITLSPLKNQYKDFTEWRNKKQQITSIKQQEIYWLKEFSGELPILELPFDYKRPPLHDFEGSTLTFEISIEMKNSLETLAQKAGTTLYILFLTLFNIFLSKLSSQEDIVVGSPIAGRRHSDLESIIGMFVNTLALRNYPSGKKQFNKFLEEVNERTLQALENQEYQYEELVEKTSTNRDLGRNPLFETMLVMQNMDNVGIDIPGLGIVPYKFEQKIAKFDLTLIAVNSTEKMQFTFEYRTKLFKQKTIERYIGYFLKIIQNVIVDKKRPISSIEMLTDKEKKRILQDFNTTDVTFPVYKTIFQLFTEQVEKSPDNIALVIQEKQKKIPRSPLVHKNNSYNMIALSYNALNLMVHHQSIFLIEEGVQPETPVAIKVERSIEMIIGILGILKSGGAYLPIDPVYPKERINYILTDSKAEFLLTTKNLEEMVELDKNETKQSQIKTILINLDILRIKMKSIRSAVIQAPDTQLSTVTDHSHTATTLAYVIYTSGTTGRPKGVLVEHRQAVNTLICRREEYKFSSQATAMQLFSFSFDGFVTSFFTPIISGAKIIIITEKEIKNLDKIKQAIQLHKVTHFICVPALFGAILESTSFVELKNLKTITLAGDSVTSNLLEQVKQKIHSIEIAIEYGVTEAAVMSTMNRHQEKTKEISIGKPTWNTNIFILGAYNDIKPIGIPGELYIGGAGISRGYLNNPELTEERFFYIPTISKKILKSKKIYKTGDLARWLLDGNIEFLGRTDQQVKIRGFRIELGEIENHLSQYKGIAEVVVNPVKIKEEKLLCAYYTGEKKIEVNGLKEFLARKLPGYMIPSYFVKLESIPITINGKIDRKALPAPQLRIGEKYTAPIHEVEKKIVEIWSNILGIPKENIGIYDNFFHLGGHSLKATLLAMEISKVFNIEFLLTAVFAHPTVKEMANTVQKSRKNIFITINPQEKKEYYPMSSTQKRLFFLQQLENIGTSYNTPTLLKVEGKLDETLFKRVLEELTQRHEALRTAFCLVNNKPVQVVHQEVNITPTLKNISQKLNTLHSSNQLLEYLDKYHQPFNLSKAPLLRVVLMALDGGGYVIFYDTHHIICDGTSVGILVTDFIELYFQKTLLPLKLQYKDFTFWQNHLYKSTTGIKQVEYWINVYRDISNGAKIPRLKLPTDYPRPDTQSFVGDQYEFKLESKDLKKLKSLNLRYGTTLYMSLLAIFNVLLYKYTDQEDIIVGSGTNERIHQDIQGVLGMFVNTLPIRNYPKPAMHFTDFLSQVKENCIQAFENQNIQFEELVERLKIKRDPSRNPLFDIEFNLQNFILSGNKQQNQKLEYRDATTRNINQIRETGSVHFTDMGYPKTTSKFDIILFAAEQGDEILFSIEYSTSLFKKETIKNMANHYHEILIQVTTNEEVTIKDIRISHDFATATPEITFDEFGF